MTTPLATDDSPSPEIGSRRGKLLRRRIGAFHAFVMAGGVAIVALERFGVRRGLLRAETNRHDLLPAELFGLATNVVGYAAFVFGPILLRLARPVADVPAELRKWAPSVHNILIFCGAFA